MWGAGLPTSHSGCSQTLLTTKPQDKGSPPGLGPIPTTELLLRLSGKPGRGVSGPEEPGNVGSEGPPAVSHPEALLGSGSQGPAPPMDGASQVGLTP